MDKAVKAGAYMSILISIDQGTTSTRTIAYDHELNVLHSFQKEYLLSFPRDGWVEVDPEHLMASVYETLDPILANNIEISGLGISNQRETTLVWDCETGEPVYPGIVWQDRRTAAMCDDLIGAGHQKTVSSKSGLLLDPYFSSTKIAWMLDNIEGLREKAGAGLLRFGTVDTFMLWQLSGGMHHKTDVTNASRTNLFNIHTLDWDDELLELFRVPRSMLPEVLPSASHFGAFARAGKSIKVTGMIGDQQSAMVGQKCFAEGDMKATFGTGCFLMVNSGTKPQGSNAGLLSTVGYQLNQEMSYALEGSIFSAGTIIQWLRDNMKFFDEAKDSENLLHEYGESNGVIFVPAFTGIGAPHWNSEVRASFYGITRDTSKQDMITAAFKALIYQVMDLRDALIIDGVKIQNLLIDGGMATNRRFCQLLANFLEQEISVPRNTESTAMGAAITAGIGAGVFAGSEDIKSMHSQLNIFRPQALSTNANDRINWQKFLKVLMEAYN